MLGKEYDHGGDEYLNEGGGEILTYVGDDVVEFAGSQYVGPNPNAQHSSSGYTGEGDLGSAFRPSVSATGAAAAGGSGAAGYLAPIINQALAFVANYLSGAQQYKYQKELMKLQSEYNEAQAKRDFERTAALQEQLLRLQYDLSSYAAQRKRLEGAGLNVGAVLSGGSVSSPSGHPSGASSSGAGVGLGSAPGGMFSGLNPLAAAQIRLTNAQASKLESETPDNDEYRGNLLADTAAKLAAANDHSTSAAMRTFDLEVKQCLRATTIAEAEESYRNVVRQGSILDSEILRSKLSVTEKAMAIYQQKLDQFTTLLKWQAMIKGIEVSDAQITKLHAEASALSARARLDNVEGAASFLELWTEVTTRAPTHASKAKAFADTILGNGPLSALFRPLVTMAYGFSHPASSEPTRQELYDFLVENFSLQ